MLTEMEMRLIISDIKYKPGYHLRLKRDPDEERWYLQVEFERIDVVTKAMGTGWSGKTWLSPHCTVSELVRRAFGTLMALEEHECRENFTWMSKRIFGPHIDVLALASVAGQVDVRTQRLERA